MKVLEIKNNLVKISYSTEDRLLLSGFVILEDSQAPYVAQVLSLKADNGTNYAIVKLLFTFDSEGIVKNYDGTIPSLDADVTKLSSDELLDILPITNPLEIGCIAHQNINLKVDRSLLEQNLLICSEDKENTAVVLENFIMQLAQENQKSIIFDIDGSFGETTLKFGEDFKLPLNYETINYIYEHDLENIEPASKAVIQDIFLEVQEYSKTVLDKFIPFDTFISVVDQQYKSTGITELVLLKNKLLKYKEENVFAQNAKDIHNLRSAIRANLTNILDISSASDNLQNEIMKYVYNAIEEMDLFVYSFVRLTNDNADKKLIRHFISKNKISTTIVCSHNYKYLYELKERANNLILFVPQTLQHDFAAYNTFLNKLNDDEFIIYGKATQNIPLIVTAASLAENETPNVTIEKEIDEEASNDIEQDRKEEPETDDFSEESNSYSYETLINDDVPQEEIEESVEETSTEDDDSEEINENVDAEEEFETGAEEEITEEPEIVEDEMEEDGEISEEEPETEIISETRTEVLPPDDEENDDSEDEEFENENETEINEEPDIETEENDNDNESEEVENSVETVSEEPEITEEDTEEEGESQTHISSSIEDNAAKVVDEIMFSQPQKEVPPLYDEIEDEVLTEDDLNFIEDVNIGKTEVPEDVPIFPAEAPIRNAAAEFEQGDKVSHPKYGEGVVEKMIKYGNKNLCSINFVNIGRRLLDPAMSEIEKID